MTLVIENNNFPQRALDNVTPIQAMKKWQEKKPELFVKRVYNQAGLDIYTSGKAMEQPLFIAFMKNPPASVDAFYDAIQALPQTVWEAGPPLWEAYEPKG